VFVDICRSIPSEYTSKINYHEHRLQATKQTGEENVKDNRISGSNAGSTKRSKKITAILISFMAIASICLAIYAFCGGLFPSALTAPLARDKNNSTQTTAPAAVIDPAAGTAIDGSYQGKSHEEVLAELKKQQVVVTDTLSSHATFASGKKGTAGVWLVENTRKNSVIQQAELYLGNVCIARTAPLQPGQYAESVTLIEDVPAGTQEVIAYMNYFNRDTRAFISRAGFKIKMTVCR
jgi:hypothetical protein